MSLAVPVIDLSPFIDQRSMTGIVNERGKPMKVNDFVNTLLLPTGYLLHGPLYGTIDAVNTKEA